jgi:hypothetical protein
MPLQKGRKEVQKPPKTKTVLPSLERGEKYFRKMRMDDKTE